MKNQKKKKGGMFKNDGYELPIEIVIRRLGFKNSKNLIYYSEFNDYDYNHHISKIIHEIKPYAIYFIDGNPFILFFDNLSMKFPLKLSVNKFGMLKFLLLCFVMIKQLKYIMDFL